MLPVFVLFPDLLLHLAVENFLKCALAMSWVSLTVALARAIFCTT